MLIVVNLWQIWQNHGWYPGLKSSSQLSRKPHGSAGWVSDGMLCQATHHKLYESMLRTINFRRKQYNISSEDDKQPLQLSWTPLFSRCYKPCWFNIIVTTYWGTGVFMSCQHACQDGDQSNCRAITGATILISVAATGGACWYCCPIFLRSPARIAKTFVVRIFYCKVCHLLCDWY